MSTYIIHGRFTLSYNFTFSFFFWMVFSFFETVWWMGSEPDFGSGNVCVCMYCTRVTVFLLTRPLKLVTQSPLFSVLPSRIQNRVLSLSFPLNNQTRRDSPHSPLLPRATCRVLLPDVSSRVYDRTIWDAERNGRARRVMSCWIEILLDLFAKAFSKEKKRE